MKKKFTVILACLLCLALCGCLASMPEDTLGSTGDSIPSGISNSTPTTVPVESSPAPTDDPNPSQPSVHQHNWADATCTGPEVCTDCGDTRGSALGHSWQDATCTQAKTCNLCGTAEGDATGHSWADATCAQPKTCTTCGETEGKAIGHSYKDGNCTRCSAVDPDAEEMVWIPTNGGTKYHTHSGCSNMKNPKQVPLSEAVAQGFTPCKRCH